MRDWAWPICRSKMPTGDYYGGHRPGNGLFGDSLVAVDLKTGQRKWFYQLVHHGMWDMDISARARAHRHHCEWPHRSRPSRSPPSREFSMFLTA